MRINHKFAALLMGGAAFIQTAPALAADAPAPDQGVAQVQEVVVTANKRSESLQKVPVAVTSLTAQTAAAVGVTDITTLQTTVPGLQFPKLFSGSSPALRGVGSSFGIGGEENEVALYIDDVYIASASVASSIDFNNISQIQVLYGPQGTLFGRNAMAGVINIDTRAPTATPKADLSLGYASYDTSSLSFYGNLPIGDKVMANLSIGADDQQDGWGKNLYTGSQAFVQKDFSIRTKWVFKPDDLTTITLIGDYSRSRYDSGVAMRPVQGALFPNGQVFQGYYNDNENVDAYVDTKQGGVSGKIDRDLGFADLISITAWRKSTAYNNADEDQTTVPSQYFSINDALQSTSEELRLVSKNTGNLTWLAGFFYFNDTADLPLNDIGTALGLGGSSVGALNEVFVQKITSYAGFGQATYALPFGFHLTGGLRYTYDTLQANGSEVVRLITPFPATFVSLADGGRTNEDAWTYKINMEKDIAPDVSAYVGYSTGFKGGIFNDADITAPAVRPETLDDLEGGIKSELFDRRLRLNIAVYHYDYNNLQVTSLTRAATGQTSSELQNAAQATNTGFEASFAAEPTRALTFSGGVEIMHSRFTSFPDATISVPLPGGGNTTVSGSAKGFMVPHSPDYSGNLTAQYRIATDFGEVLAALNGSYESPFAWDADNRLKQHAYGLLSGSVLWQPTDTHWEARLWAKNITNTHYSIYTTANVVGDEESPAPPLTFGLTVTRHFF
jgi:iron complex outermembrane receptor protein